ncbi:hypothetical protein [Clostridium sardiniense]|uniref:hypothetical protein n=1 Tax=Clostridium sardiniense TaxID=29369 RepID=UPI00195F01D5|nr:hypothetical protein [Clostridium sardiniense]MBM7834819.1 hypothetical protein [Clostridium sardiniense]
MKKRKIVFLMSCVMGVSIIFSGCSKEKTIVLDQKVQESKEIGESINEKIINLDVQVKQLFIPLYLEGDKIYGTFGLSQGTFGGEGTKEYPVYGIFKKNLYALDTKGNLEESNKVPLNYTWGINANAEGVSAYIFNKNLNEVYYYNNKTNVERHIGEFTEGEIYEFNQDIVVEHEKKGSYDAKSQIIEGNTDYAYIIENEEKSDEVGEDKLLKLEIININDNKKYIYKGKDILRIEEIVYSNITDEFYVIDYTGNIYTLVLEKDEITLKNKWEINIKGIGRLRSEEISITNEGEIIILNTEGDGERLSIIYNPKTKETKYINKSSDENLRVAKFFNENNKVILSKQTENKTADIYIGEIDNDSLKIIKKLDFRLEKDEKSLLSSAIMSEDGKKILVGTHIYIYDKDKKQNIKDRYQYNLLEIN